MTSEYPVQTSIEQQSAVGTICDCGLGSLCAILLLEVWLLNAWRQGQPPSDLSPILFPLFMLTLLAAVVWIARKIILFHKGKGR